MYNSLKNNLILKPWRHVKNFQPAKKKRKDDCTGKTNVYIHLLIQKHSLSTKSVMVTQGQRMNSLAKKHLKLYILAIC